MVPAACFRAVTAVLQLGYDALSLSR
jgi:hypothetical protein